MVVSLFVHLIKFESCLNKALMVLKLLHLLFVFDLVKLSIKMKIYSIDQIFRQQNSILIVLFYFRLNY